MLEQAIIDAEALRETALKNAEAQVIEKYSSEIKEAVENLLEQEEEDPLGGLGGDDQAADAPEAGLEGNMEKDAEALLDKTSAAAKTFARAPMKKMLSPWIWTIWLINYQTKMMSLSHMRSSLVR
jgi:hypothetical protein